MSSSSSTPISQLRSGARLNQENLGWVAMSVTLLVWAGFSVSLRAISRSTLTSADVALIRFLVPAIALLPFIPARLAALKAMRLQHAVMIAIGAGLPFFMIAAAGGRLTSAAHVSVLVAGTVPLSIALLAYLFWREPIKASRRLGLAIIVAGVALLVAGLGAIALPMLEGVGLLLIASLFWAMFTLGLRSTTLDPVGTLMLITYPSLFALLLLMATGMVDNRIGQANLNEIGLFVLVQGCGVGILSPLTYAAAIRCLGALRCASAGALAPVIATVIAIPLLHEIPTVLSMAGVLLVTAGVVLSNRTSKGVS